MVRALASDHGGPGSILGIDITCGLSFLLVLNFGPRGLFSGDLVFRLKNHHFQIPVGPEMVDEESLR